MSEPSWYTACAAAVAKLGGTMCPESTCNSRVAGPYLYEVCNCVPPYRNGCTGPNPPKGCCVYTQASPLPIAGQNCFCCCGWSMPPEAAEDAEAARSVKEYVPGDPIYVVVELSPQELESRPVAWSGGVGRRTDMVRVVFADGGAPRQLVVDGGHLFLTSEGDLERADGLVAGTDELVAPDGSPREILGVEIGVIGESHQVATTTTPATTPEGHLIVLNGVVCGDWALQVGMATSG